MFVTLDNVLLRDPTLTAEEILMSESQERMMAIVRPEKLDAFLAVTTKWDVEASVLGEVTDTGRLVIEWKGQTIVDVDPRTVAIDGPVYNRPMEYPTWLDALQADSPNKFARATEGDDLKKQFLAILGSPNEADTDWITNQYDYYVMGNTALHTPDGAGMIRIDEESGLGVALATDANGRYCQLDPYVGAQLALVEAYRNVASSGATPMAVSDCLNFGSPENPEVMWQFARAVEGLADGCLELGIPVTGGNVSFYNQTGDVPIHPTPVVAVLGSIDNVARRLPSGWQDDGENLYLLGITHDELGGSAWAGAVHNHLGGVPPRVDFDAEKNVAGLLSAAAIEGLVTSATDLGTGGFLRAVADGVLRFGVGARVWIDEIVSRDGVDSTAALFSETQARVLVSVAREDDVKFRGLCDGRNVAVLRVGVTDSTSNTLEVQGLFEIPVTELSRVHRGTLPAHFGAVVGG
jgi:phosphoribosylformylglycinamidine synthase